jgi:tetratricopeptide (TPR) repeat protein
MKLWKPQLVFAGLAVFGLIEMTTQPGFGPAFAAQGSSLVGPVTKADLRTAPFSEWFDGQYSRYQPPAAAVESLRPALAGVSIEAYFGVWCGDSKRQIPRLLRLLDLAGFDERNVTLIGLSDQPMRFKQAPANPEAKRQVHRTPTIVVVRAGTEIGRVVETPSTSLEADLLAILGGQPPKPKYGAEGWVHQLFLEVSSDDAIKALEAAGPEVRERGDAGSLWHYAEHDLLKNGKPREAKAVLDLHLRLNPESVIGHVLRAEALIALGQKADARDAVDRALSLDATNQRARRLQARLQNP